MLRRNTLTGFLVLLFVTGMVSLVLAASTPSDYGRPKYPIPSWEGDQLAKVREWEKTWVGKKIDGKNIDQVKDFFPEYLYHIYKDVDKWQNSWFDIVPYQTFPQPAGKIKYTKEGKCWIDEKEVLKDYVAGVCFPEPKVGVEVAWNYDRWTRGESIDSKGSEAYIIDGKIKYDRMSQSRGRNMNFSGRTWMPPTPEVDNPKQILRATFAEFFFPIESKGNIILQVRYKDPWQPYDTWSYSPSIRRIRRASTAQRTDPTSSGDWNKDDDWIWDGAINRNKYKLLGRPDRLYVRHLKNEQVTHTEGKVNWDGLSRERIRPYQVEVKNVADAGYIYDHMVFEYDPESWMPQYADKYDRYGKIFKVQELYQRVFTSKYEPTVGFQEATNAGGGGGDYTRIHGSCLIQRGLEIGIPLSTELYTVNNLAKYGH